MAQFFLNVRDGRERLIDSVGYEFPALDDAREAAIVAARQVLSGAGFAPDAVAGKEIEIADSAGHTLLSMSVGEILMH